jgi:hypothetical protein
MLQNLDGLGANGFTHNGFAEHVRMNLFLDAKSV